jgi:hypothetical protein
MHHEALLEVTGPRQALEAFGKQALSDHLFSFERLHPTPASLHIETGSFADDGYAAVAGDWQRVAGRDMLREPAARLGLALPLGSRADVLACYAGLGEIGQAQLGLGRQLQRNLLDHGHPNAASWRKAHWGIECDCEDVVADVGTGAVRIAFRLLGTPPKKSFSLLSARFPELVFRLRHVNPVGKRAAELVLGQGKEVSKDVLDAPSNLAIIQSFRQASGLKWLAQVAGEAAPESALRFDQTGKAVFAGTGMALTFALSRLRAGESAQELAGRFPELTNRHIHALEQLWRARYNAGR